MIINTAELTGAALDWAVAKAINLPHQPDISRDCVTPFTDSETRHLTQPNIEPFKPSTKWKHGGPLVEEYSVAILKQKSYYSALAWRADGKSGDGDAESHLVAAMRAIVASEIGDTVEIPSELCQ